MLTSILLNYVVPVIVPVLAGLAASVLRKLARKIDADADAVTTERLLARVAHTATTVVAAVEQSLRPTKHGEKLAANERRALREAALEGVKRALGRDTLHEIGNLLGSHEVSEIDAFLVRYIEAAVYNMNAARNQDAHVH